MQNWTTCLAYQKIRPWLNIVTDEDGHPLEKEMNHGRGNKNIWVPFLGPHRGLEASCFLTCAFLAFLMMYCNKSLVKPAMWHKIAQPMCHGRPFASLYAVSLCNLRFLPRCLTSQDSAPRKREDYQHECGRPHDTLSCFFFTALWLGQGQAILTQIQQTDDVDMTCCNTLPTKSVT